jgi:DNA-binding CsgD family transcriptional regulator/guanylate kinase
VPVEQNFSSRESDIIACLINRLSYKAIAKILKMSPKTVDAHIRNILAKSEYSSKEQLIDALKQKLVFGNFEKRYAELTNYNKSNTENTLVKKMSFSQKTILKAIAIVILLLGTLVFFEKNLDRSIKVNLNKPVISDKYFINREDILQKMTSCLKRRNKINIVALVGHGGAGKTTIARKYLELLSNDFVGEINAESIASIKKSFEELGQVLADSPKSKEDLKYIWNIQNEEERYRQLIYFVRSRLKKFSGWSLILDNVENIGLLREFYPYNYRVWGKGNIILTTRNNDIKNVNYIENLSVIPVEELSEQEKSLLFFKILQNSESSESTFADNLLKHLPNFPLDVSAAAHYIKNVGIDFEEYLRRMNEMSEEFLKLNQKLMLEYNSYDKTRYGIITSIFKNIISENANCAETILLICFLDSQNIPLKLLNKMKHSSITDTVVCQLKRYALIKQEKNRISINGSIQKIGLNYCINLMNYKERMNFMKKVISLLTPYKHANVAYKRPSRLIPHLKACLNNLSKLDLKETDKAKIDLFLTLGEIYKNKEQASYESLFYFDQALEINSACNYLDDMTVADVMLTAGEAAVYSNFNDKAMKYLQKSFIARKYNKLYALKFAYNYNLLGMLYMRKGNFRKAEEQFNNALKILDSTDNNNEESRLIFGKVYKHKAINICMHQINKKGMTDAVQIMSCAANILSQKSMSDDLSEFARKKELAEVKIHLAGFYNGIMDYISAKKMTDEAEILLNELSSQEDSDCFRSRGILLMEQGHTCLRMNNLELSKEKFQKAKILHDKIRIGDYIPRLRMQEAEVLIRLGDLDQAYENCKDLFAMSDKDRNDLNLLFFNTCHYNAAVIKYNQSDFARAEKHFKDFFSVMKIFCKNFLDKPIYENLLKEEVFSANTGDFPSYFEKSLKIFKAVCLTGSEFITDYIEVNYQVCIAKEKTKRS